LACGGGAWQPAPIATDHDAVELSGRGCDLLTAGLLHADGEPPAVTTAVTVIRKVARGDEVLTDGRARAGGNDRHRMTDLRCEVPLGVPEEQVRDSASTRMADHGQDVVNRAAPTAGDPCSILRIGRALRTSATSSTSPVSARRAETTRALVACPALQAFGSEADARPRRPYARRA
jgi:hypothetical protein